MATKIRLTRRGSKRRPFYWIVVADSRSPRDGAFIEKIGTYNPLAKDGEKAKIDQERAEHWLSNGAQPSDRVGIFLDKAGLRKKTQRYNPQKGVAKAKAQERMKDAGKDPSAAVEPSVQSIAFDENDKEAARMMMQSLISAA